MLNGASSDSHWLAVHTKPRQEGTAEIHLARQGFCCYLPRAFNPRRLLPSQNPRVEPVFSRYLFIRACPGQDNLAAVSYTRGVARLVRFGSRLARVPDWVIERLQSATDPGTGLVRMEPASFANGDEVDILHGPMAGMRAVFQAADGDERAFLLIELLGRGATISVPSDALRVAR